MIKLRWSPFPEVTVSAYHIYRSIIGFTAPVMDLTGKTLKLKINNGSVQEHTFETTDTVGEINSHFMHCHAYLMDGGDNFALRSDVRTAPGSVELLSCSAATALGITPRVIGEKTEDELIAVVPGTGGAGSDTYYNGYAEPAYYEFSDPDGTLQDWYAISTLDEFANESLKSQYRQPISSSGALCIIEGLVVNMQGTRVADALVRATLCKQPQGQNAYTSVLASEAVEVYTGPDGRFSLPILQGIYIELEIPSLSFQRRIQVPQKPFCYLNDLMVELACGYPLECN